MRKTISFAVVASAITAAAFMFSATASAVTVPDLSQGLIGSWTADEGSGLTMLDSSGLGHAFTLKGAGAGRGMGKVGTGALSLDGLTGYAETSYSHVGAGLPALSVSVWFKANVASSAVNRGIICVPAKGSVKSTFCMNIARSGSTGKLAFNVSNSAGTTSEALANASFASTDWVHAVGVYDGAKVSLYINGVLQTKQTALSGATSDPGQPLRLDYSNVYGDLGTFGGSIDDIRIYNRALSSDDVSALFGMADTSGDTGGQTGTTTPDTTAPTVSLTAPLSGASLTGTTTVSATASDASGVAGVSFYADGTLIAPEDISAPYAVSWDITTVTAGAHNLVAVARDTAGNVATSSPASVTVVLSAPKDTTAPVVSMTAPTSGSTVQGSITLSANASDNVGVASVRFVVDGAYVGSALTSAPYQLAWDSSAVSNGAHSIAAAALDQAGNAATSSSVAITVNNPPSGSNSTTTSSLDSGLSLHLAFEERAGTTIVDSSPKATPGSYLSSPLWAKGKFGSGLFFPGSGQYASFPTSHAGASVGTVSVSLWFKPSIGAYTVNRGLVCVPANGPTKSSFCTTIQRTSVGGKLGFGVGNAAGTYITAYSDAVFNSTGWVHLAGVYDGSKLNLYVNGVLQKDQPALSGMTANALQPVLLNYSNVYGDRGTFAGIMDDVRVYDRALSPSEVAALYALPDTDTPFVEDLSDIWIASPDSAAIVAGTTTPISAQVDDGDPMMSMQFYLDGAPLGAADSFAPFSVVWDTMKTTNGLHTLTATGVLPSGALTTAPAVVVEVKNIPDSVAPSVPAMVKLTPVSPKQIDIAWTPSTDNVTIKNYDVYRCQGIGCTPNTLIGTKASPFIIDAGLAAATSYSYSVVARDGSNNVSAPSAPVEATTLGSTPSCGASSDFSFGIFSDTYSGQESGLRSAYASMLAIDPNLRFVVSGGDTPSYQRVRGIADEFNGKEPCVGSKFPWFPAAGNHDAENDSYMAWWATNWTGDWTNAPQASPLATQMSGISNFKRGPTQVMTPNGFSSIQPGTIYSFDYKNSHFLILNTYEQGISDAKAGVWDLNGSTVSDPTTSQLDWIARDLASSTKPFKFAFAHNALLTPTYSWDHVPPGWSEHNSSFHMDDLAKVFSANNVTAYFYGHDHVASRQLVDGNRTALYKRLYWDTTLDPLRPFGDLSWTPLQGTGKTWEVDAGRVYDGNSYFTIARVSDAAVTFEIYYMPTYDQSTIYLWDTFTVPVS